MQLDSYLEIFTTMYGWAFANIIGEVLTGTGLIVVPFMLIVFNAWREAKEAGVENVSITGLIDSVGTKLIIAMFVFSLCFAASPFATLASVNLSHTPPPTLSVPVPVTVNQSNTGSTYDTAMVDALSGTMSSSGGLSNVPLWWYSVMAISSGFNSSIRAGVTANVNQIRMVEDLARTLTIADPKLLRNIQRFYSECFSPAQSKYNNMAAGAPSANVAMILADSDYGAEDVGWMGSQIFRTEPGFYDSMRSITPVPGFVIKPLRDTEYFLASSGLEPPHSGQVNPDWGRPTCKEWWESEYNVNITDSVDGVRESMINHSSEWRKLLTQAGNLFNSTDKSKDAVARLAQSQASPQFIDTLNAFGVQHDVSTFAIRTVGGMVSTIGVAIGELLTNISVGPLLDGLLMMQALTLMGMFMFLPLVVFFSGYDLKVMLYGAVGIFTVKFWAVLWFVAYWVDGHIINAMYPGNNYDWNDLIHNLQNGYKRSLLNILLLMMFIGLPAIWTAMMSWVGIRIGGELEGVLGGADKTANNVTSKSSGGLRGGGGSRK